MQDTVTARRRCWVWLTAMLVVVALVGVGGSLWALIAGFELNGTRIAIVIPTRTHASSDKVPLVTVSADLAAAGVRGERDTVSAEGSNILFVQRERAEMSLFLTAGDAPLDTDQLGYALFAADGALIRTGRLRPGVRIEPGKTVTVEFVDVRVTEADRVEIRKLP